MSNELLVSNVVALGPRKTRRDDVVGGRGGWGGSDSVEKTEVRRQGATRRG